MNLSLILEAVDRVARRAFEKETPDAKYCHFRIYDYNTIIAIGYWRSEEETVEVLLDDFKLEDELSLITFENRLDKEEK